MAPYHFIPCLVIGFSLFTLIFFYTNNGFLKNLLKGQAFGFGYHVGGLYWIGNALMTDPEQFGVFLPLAVAGLPFALGFFYGLPAAFTPSKYSKTLCIVCFAFLLGLGDYLRSVLFTGFPWNLPVYALGFSDIMMQSVYPLGAYPLNFIVIFLAVAPGAFFILQNPKAKIGLASGFVILIAAGYGYGQNRLENVTLTPVSESLFRIVQPNIAQQLKWAPEARLKHFNRLIRLTEQKGENGKRPDIIIWPETALQLHPEINPPIASRLRALTENGAEIITGKMRFTPSGDGDYDYFNSVLQISAKDGFKFVYDKIKLVPFGEYLPLRPILSRLGLTQINFFKSGFQKGEAFKVFRGPKNEKLAAEICYEIIFPDFSRKLSRKLAPDLIINVTNDAWFGDSPGPFQHLMQARFRAVETGTGIIRAANTGVSAYIDPLGRVKKALNFNTDGIIDFYPNKI